MANDKTSFLWAIKQQESGGNYNSRNSSSGALGAYQVMPANVPDWTKQALGRSLTPAQFLANPSAQDAVANVILGGYYDQYGPDGAAAMWYSGQPNPNKSDPGDSPTIRQYVDQVVGRMSSSSPVGGATPVGGSFPVPVPLPGGGSASIPVPLPSGSDLAAGIQQGLITAFKSVVGPVLTWTFWLFETGIGFAALAGGVLLIAQKSDTVRSLENIGTRIAAPEAVAVLPSPRTTASPAVFRPASKTSIAPNGSQKSIADLVRSHGEVDKRVRERERIRLAKAKKILEPSDYKKYRAETT